MHVSQSLRPFLGFLFAPPGQQTGQTPAPRYLWPRPQVFQPPLFAFGTIVSPFGMTLKQLNRRANELA
jgi:hypothetical protein